MIQMNSNVVKNIKWITFRLSDDDWQWVDDTHAILEVSILSTFIMELTWLEDSHKVQHQFSLETVLTLWCALPVIEELLTAWEKKKADPCFAPYANAIDNGCVKIHKYYNRFDMKPGYIMSLSMLFVFFQITPLAHSSISSSSLFQG